MQLWCDLRNYTAFAWRAEDTRKNPQSKFSVSNLRFEPTTSRIQRRSAVHLTATFRVHVVHVLMKKEDGIYVACNTHQRGKNCTQSFGQKKSEGKRLFSRPICRWEHNIKMGLKEMCENLGWILPGLG